MFWFVWLEFLFVCLKKDTLGLLGTKVKNLRFFNIYFSNLLGSSKYVPAKYFLLVTKAPRETFQESYTAFTR